DAGSDAVAVKIVSNKCSCDKPFLPSPLAGGRRRLLDSGDDHALAYMFALVSATVSWQPWQHLSGVFDLAGPRSDGRLVVAAGGRLFLVATDGAIAPFADGQGGYQVASGPEAYLDVSPGLHVGSANCNFARDDVFVIRPTPPIGITRVDPQGHATNFVDLTGVDSLNGIVFDTVGRFDHRLLVSGLRNQHSTIVAVDCKGGGV